MLENYTVCRLEKEQELKRQRSLSLKGEHFVPAGLIFFLRATSIRQRSVKTMSDPSKDYFAKLEKTCGPLLYELQAIWEEIGESESDKDKTYNELEQECLETHRKKLDNFTLLRAELRQTIADNEAELAAVCSAMAERPEQTRQPNNNTRGLKTELSIIIPQVEEMRKKKSERVSKFLDVIEQIHKISLEIGFTDCDSSKISFNESDLSVRKLDELYNELESLQREKSERLKKVMGQLKTLNSICLVLALNFQETVQEVHPSLDQNEGSKNISNDTINRLETSIQKLREIKIQRMKKIQDLAATMLELWDLMDTPIEEQQLFQNVTCTVASLEHEINEPNILSLHFLTHVETEVLRLQQLKASKMKDLILKKKFELEEIRKRTHLIPEDSDTDFALEAIEAGAIDPSLVLEQIEEQISLSKEESFSRKDILERVDKWLSACNEESWLEEYNRDENRYNAGKGVHLSLKRAEKARAVTNKIPSMLDNLSAKIKNWEREKGKDFTYDGVRVLSMLENYTVCRLEKEQELKRQREQKKIKGQLITEQETLYGSKPSPSKPSSAKKGSRPSIGPSRPSIGGSRPSISGSSLNRRLSLGGTMIHSLSPSLNPSLNRCNSTQSTQSVKRMDCTRNLSPGRRGMHNPGLPTKKLQFNPTRLAETPRKPFSQIPPPKNNNSLPSTPLKQIPPSNNNNHLITMPLKRVISVSARTPILVPVLPMQVAATPAGTQVVKELEMMEYSFEERRLKCYLAA